jgi:hypothetical protein
MLLRMRRMPKLRRLMLLLRRRAAVRRRIAALPILSSVRRGADAARRMRLSLLL